MPRKDNRSAADSVSAARLRELLDYDPATGVFTWKPQPAGTVNGEGYVQIRIDGKLYTGHRLAVLMMTGEWPEDEVDHRNRKRADNAWSNLVSATGSDNHMNTGLSARNTSGYRGVTWNRRAGKWQAKIGAHGRQIHLGNYDCPEVAYAAYLSAREKHYGLVSGSQSSDASEVA